MIGELTDDDNSVGSSDLVALQDHVVMVGAAIQDGPEATIVRVESCYGKGFAGVQIIGNTGQIVEDGKERARTALERLGYSIPARRLTISVSPGDIKVEGSHLDLAMTVAIAAQLARTPFKVATGHWVFAAEVGLTGELRPVPGVICQGVAAMIGEKEGVVVAEENLAELQTLAAVSLKSGRKLVFRAFRDVASVLEWLSTGEDRPEVGIGTVSTSQPAERLECPRPPRTYEDMNLTPELCLVAMVAATGMHSMLLRGAPGSGKSMFAERLISLLPPLEPEEHLSVLQTHSAHHERIPEDILAGRPPFRSPHHQASASAILGASNRPGEIALASHGILFLDEFPEYRRDVIESLRQPLESGEVQVSRAHRKMTWRAKTMLIAAANNCPCGWRGSKVRRCLCSENRVTAYQNRISGPILDRIDLHLNMPERQMGIGLIQQNKKNQNVLSFPAMRERVAKARRQAEKRNLTFGVRHNRDLTATVMEAALGMDDKNLECCLKSILPLASSARAVLRCLRVARSVADVNERDLVSEEDIVQAVRWQQGAAATERGDLSIVGKAPHETASELAFLSALRRQQL